jgi:glutaredoxin
MTLRTFLWLMLVLGAAGGAWSWWQGREQPLHTNDPRQLTGDSGIVMLAADWCGYCRKQQKDFEMAGVRYRVLDVDTDEGGRAAAALGTRGVPVTVVGQQVIRGYDTVSLKQNLEPLGYRVY